MNKNTLYVTGIIAVAAIGAFFQYQLCCSESAVLAKTQALQIDKDNTEVLPKRHISGLSIKSPDGDGQHFLFNSGTHQLQPIDSRLQNEVKHIVDELEKTPYKSLQITGQYREGQPYELGLNRADAVSRLFAKAGLSTDRIVTQVNKVKHIPTKGAQSVATELAVITNQNKLKALEVAQLLEKAQAAHASAEQKTQTLAAEKTVAEENLMRITAEKDKLTKQLTELNNEKTDTETHLNQLLSDKQSLEERLKAAVTEKITLVEKNETALATAARKLTDSKAAVTQLESVVEAQTVALAEAEEKITQTLQTLKVSSVQNEKNQQTVTRLEQQLARAETDKTEALSKLQAAIAAREATERDLEAQKQQAETDLAFAHGVISSLESELQTQDATLKAQKSALAATESQIAQDEVRWTALSHDLDESKAAVSTLQTVIEEQKTALTVSEEKIAQVQATAVEKDEKNRQTVTRLKQQLARAETDKTETLSQLQAVITAGKATEQSLEALKQKSETALSAAEATVVSLTAELAERESALTKAKSQVEQALLAASGQAGADEALTALNRQITTLETAKKTTEETLARTIAAKQAAEEQLAQAATDRQTLEEKLSRITKQTTATQQAAEADLAQAIHAKKALEAELAQVTTAKQAAEEQLAQAATDRQTLEEKLNLITKQTTATQQAAEADLAQAIHAKKALEAELAQVTTAKQAAEKQLAQAVDARKAAEAGRLTAIETANNNIADSIRKAPLQLYFRTNQTAITLNAGQQQKVAVIKKYLESVPTAELLVIGHTDNTGNRNMNIQLGLKRANFAADWLAQSGIARDRMVIESKGPDAPIAGNATRGDRALNRRVEVTVK